MPETPKELLTVRCPICYVWPDIQCTQAIQGGVDFDAVRWVHWERERCALRTARALRRILGDEFYDDRGKGIGPASGFGPIPVTAPDPDAPDRGVVAR